MGQNEKARSTLRREPADLNNTPEGPYVVREKLDRDGDPMRSGLFVMDGVGIGSGPLAIIVRRGAPWSCSIGLQGDADLAALFAAAPALLVLVKEYREECVERRGEVYDRGTDQEKADIIPQWDSKIAQIDEVLNVED